MEFYPDPSLHTYLNWRCYVDRALLTYLSEPTIVAILGALLENAGTFIEIVGTLLEKTGALLENVAMF